MDKVKFSELSFKRETVRLMMLKCLENDIDVYISDVADMQDIRYFDFQKGVYCGHFTVASFDWWYLYSTKYKPNGTIVFNNVPPEECCLDKIFKTLFACKMYIDLGKGQLYNREKDNIFKYKKVVLY